MWIRRKLALPEAVRKDNDGRSIRRPVLVRKKCTSEGGTKIEHTEITRAHIFAAHPFRFTRIRNAEFSGREACDRLKGRRQGSRILKLRIRPRHPAHGTIRRGVR